MLIQAYSVAAINKFNTGEFRFYWIHFFPLRQDRDDFFHYLWPEVQQLLSTMPILESMTGDRRVPSDLAIVPEEYTYGIANPLIPSASSIFTYVSQNYPAEDREALESLGVRRVSAKDFLDDLSNFIKKSAVEFQSMDNEWHSRLSQILDPLTAKFGKLIFSLPIIPLRNGKWTAANSGLLLFPLAAGNLVVPDYINAFVIHPDAANDSSRRTLLSKLQARDATKAEVCSIIIQYHMSPRFKSKNIFLRDMVSHAEFLCKARWVRNSPDEYIWVVTEDHYRHRSDQVYMDTGELHSAGQVFKNHKKSFKFLHEAYSKIFTRQADMKWIQENIGVGLIPRLVVLSSAGTFSLSNDFRFLVDSCMSSDVLQLLKAHWNYYRQWILTENFQTTQTEPSSIVHDTPHSKIRAFLSLMNVRCHDGSFVPLDQTYLPRSTILQGLDISKAEPKSNATISEDGPTTIDGLETANELLEVEQTENNLPSEGTEIDKPKSKFPLLAVPEPEQNDWDFLEKLGVVITLKAKDLIVRLKQLQRNASSPEKVTRLYKRMQTGTNEGDTSLIKLGMNLASRNRTLTNC